MQRNKALISGRDGEIRQLNPVECIGSSGACVVSLCRKVFWNVFMRGVELCRLKKVEGQISKGIDMR